MRVILRLPYGLYVRDRDLVAPAKVTIRLSVLRDGVFHTEIEDEIYEKQTGAFEKTISSISRNQNSAPPSGWKS